MNRTVLSFLAVPVPLLGIAGNTEVILNTGSLFALRVRCVLDGDKGIDNHRQAK
jgi:hypothetical protein